jgi:hypothetical protein
MAEYELLYDEGIPRCTICWVDHFDMMLGYECVTAGRSVEEAQL